MLMARLLVLVAIAAPASEGNDRVPALVIGPDVAATARQVDAPIDEVTVYSDRARVRRRATLQLDKGAQSLRLPDVPGAAWIDTVRVQADGAKVVRVELESIDRERFSVEEVDALIEKLEGLRDQIAENTRFASVLQAELDLLDKASPSPPVPEHERAGKAAPVAPVEWGRVLDFMDGRRVRIHADLRRLHDEHQTLVRDANTARRDIEARDLGAWTHQILQVVAIVEAASAERVRLELEYFLPGAQWVPSYDLAYDAATRKVQLYTAGLVQQSTGETWNNVALHLSTAIPGQGIDMPELLTWTLGERQDFMPSPRPRHAATEQARYAPPEPAADLDSDRLVQADLVERRLGVLRALASAEIDADSGFADREPAKASIGRGVGSGGQGIGSLRAMAKPSMEPTSGARFEDVMAMPAEGADAADEPSPPPSPVAMAESPRPGSVRVGRSMNLGLEEAAWARPMLAAHLPASLAGGLDHVYSVPVRASVPSDAGDVRVPLRTDSYPVRAFYEATPALKETAFLRARVTNQSAVPLLRGTVNIFVSKDFAGQGELPTTGTGGVIELPLGADEDVRLSRRVVASTAKQGVISKEDVTTYRVTIEAANHKREAIRIRLSDQIPVSRHEDVKIALDDATPTPREGPGATGHLMWELDIEPGKVQTLTFNYSLRRPADFRLWQE